MLKRFFIFLFLVYLSLPSSATHNRAGEITYKQLSSYTFEFTITTFTNTRPTSNGTIPADRPSLVIQWGDNTFSELPRSGLSDLPDFYRKNTYTGTHTYSGPSTFEVVVEDPNRNEGVQNIPNSVMTVFSIKTILQINPNLGSNSTPILLNPPVDKAAIGQVFIHNPAAYDPDGDSLSYELTVCTGENGIPIPNYTFPPSSNRPIFIEPATGNLIWDAPTQVGSYNVAFYIFEWRKGIKIGRITRDMQIEVFESNNTPPVIDSIASLCVAAGETALIQVVARDNANETIRLSATGGSFNTESPSTFTSVPSQGTVTGIYNWDTKCIHVRRQPYQIVFKATDNNSDVNLVDQQDVSIKVIGAAPKNLQLLPTNNSITLLWDSYNCTYHIGYNIYRSNQPYGFTPDSCETGVPIYTGFKLIKTLNTPQATSYVDNNNEKGLTQGYSYCYIITAVYTENFESQASDEICGELVRGTPIITNVSVTKHDDANGEIFVGWSKPIELDTIKHPGPYQYIVRRATDIWGTDYQNIDTLQGLNDTIYFDTPLNTSTNSYNYKIELHNSQGLTEMPMTASSLYPKIDGNDKKLTLQLIKNTPWKNYQYNVFRQNEDQITFDSIGFTNTELFEDAGLQNQKEYCYRITSYGKYDLGGIQNPLINESHINCGTPLDTVPPEAPLLEVASNCSTFYNTLTWTVKGDINQITKYMIYFAPASNVGYALIDSVMDKDSLSYFHYAGENPSGCYQVSAVDSNLNESSYSNFVCVDICSYYELPNVFTPDGDGINDLFIPLPPADVIDNAIEQVEMNIYSRWGNPVYETTDPHILWDGKSSQTGIKVAPGVYYYICDVYEKRVSGIEHRTLTGFVHVLYSAEASE
jgi:gliding motility-associated-like protein